MFRTCAIFVLASVALADCAANSGVAPIGPDTFIVSRQAATGFSGTGTLKAEALIGRVAQELMDHLTHALSVSELNREIDRLGLYTADDH